MSKENTVREWLLWNVPDWYIMRVWMPLFNRAEVKRNAKLKAKKASYK